MKPDCVKQVEVQIGRKLGKGESERIEARLANELRQLAVNEPAFATMSQSERLLAAAKSAMEAEQARAGKTAQRRALNLSIQVRESQALKDRASELGGKHPFVRALFERLRQVENHIVGVRNEMFAKIVDVMKAANPEFFGLIENRKMRDAFVRELYGEDTGNKVMHEAAKQWTKAAEEIRLRENAAGSDIGELGDWRLPQPHDAGAIVKAGKTAWVAKTLPLMAREKFVTESGRPLTDMEMQKFLEHAYDTLATEGLVRREPGAGARGSRASRFDEKHRILHFKDADSYLAYMDDFGNGSAFEAVNNHVTQQSRNIGMLEAWGPNPSQTYRLLKDIAETEDSSLAGKAITGEREFGATTDMVWDTINGTVATPVNPRTAAVMQAVRNYITAARLQGVMLSSINDSATWLAVAKTNGVPLGQAFSELMGSLSGKNIREDAARLGLAVESMTSEMSTWHQQNLNQKWWDFGKLANATMKLGLVEGWTQRLRAGFGLMLSDQLATMRATDFAALSKYDRDRLKHAGVTETDWKVWQAAGTENIRGRDLLTMNSVRDTQGFSPSEVNHATAALLGFIDNEAKTAVLAPDVVTRAAITQGQRAGTLGGEFGRSLMLFKSFPLAMVKRHMDRIRSLPTAQGKIAYSVALMTGLTLMGALSVELKDLVAGRNPRDATTPKFWGAAFAQGGGLGIYGDVIYQGLGGNSRNGTPNWMNLAGPVVGTAADALNVTLGNLGDVLRGKKTNAGAEIIRFVRQNLPLLSIWYLKAAVDHAGFADLQETLSPGYLARQRAAAKRDWNQGYWWEPGSGLPTEAPNFAAIAGE